MYPSILTGRKMRYYTRSDFRLTSPARLLTTTVVLIDIFETIKGARRHLGARTCVDM